MTRRLALSAIAAALVAALAGRAPAVRAQAPAHDPGAEARLSWFREAKFGLFIHWGLYAIPAGEWKGKAVPGIGEWIMNRAQIPVAEYEKLAGQFNPVEFDADAWVRLAQDAGMKYIVITSKHHDGFALYGSQASRFNVVDATPFKRDVLKELSEACRRRGMRLGFYYSQSQDWHEADAAGNTWDFGPDDRKDYDKYLRGKAEPQVRELLTGYGPVALVWFDTPRMMTPERARRFTDLVRSLQPQCLIDGRLGAAGDYISTGDNAIPPRVGTAPWETPATINHTWGYRKDDHDWKSPGDITFKLLDIVSKGGNYLLNVGPTADGVIPGPSQEVLRTVGRWLTTNGEAVYGAGPTPFGEELGDYAATATDAKGQKLFLPRTDWRVTTKPGKLYFTFFKGQASFELPAMTNSVRRAYLLAGGGEVAIRSEGTRRVLEVPRPLPDPMATVIVVEFEGERVTR